MISLVFLSNTSRSEIIDSFLRAPGPLPPLPAGPAGPPLGPLPGRAGAEPGQREKMVTVEKISEGMATVEKNI